MTRFDIQILGCGSAMPTTLHNPSAQLVDVNEKLFMIDCGEGTQLQMRKFKTRMSKLNGIFISHLHGDHVFGLPGLLSTLSLLGRNGDLNIYAHKELDLFLHPFIKYFGNQFSYRINLIPLDPGGYRQVFENKSIRIGSFPLKHRIPTSGFLFEEKESPRHIKREMIDFYNIPFHQIQEIKSGSDFIAGNGEIIKNDILTVSPAPPRKYAYCSDTAFFPEIIEYIQNADVLYHEATFSDSDRIRAQETFHSTARQAAEIAKAARAKKLVIGHFSSRYTELNQLRDEAASVFENTELAFEGMKIQL